MAERKYAERKAAEDDNAAAFECCLSISDPVGDVLCDLSMLRPLDDHLTNEKRSVTTEMMERLVEGKRAEVPAGNWSGTRVST